MMCKQNLVLFCKFVLKILSKNQFLTSIKGRNSFANLRKTMIYNTNIDLVNDYVYTKFGLNRTISFQGLRDGSLQNQFLPGRFAPKPFFEGDGSPRDGSLHF